MTDASSLALLHAKEVQLLKSAHAEELRTTRETFADLESLASLHIKRLELELINAKKDATRVRQQLKAQRHELDDMFAEICELRCACASSLSKTVRSSNLPLYMTGLPAVGHNRFACAAPRFVPWRKHQTINCLRLRSKQARAMERNTRRRTHGVELSVGTTHGHLDGRGCTLL